MFINHLLFFTYRSESFCLKIANQKLYCRMHKVLNIEGLCDNSCFYFQNPYSTVTSNTLKVLEIHFSSSYTSLILFMCCYFIYFNYNFGVGPINRIYGSYIKITLLAGCVFQLSCSHTRILTDKHTDLDEIFLRLQLWFKGHIPNFTSPTPGVCELLWSLTHRQTHTQFPPLKCFFL